jgi:lipopolysaccharide transport system ATP-binding protein
MSETVIKVENLGKKYIIGHQAKERYLTFRDSIANKAKALLSPFSSKKTEPTQEEFWALKDISFEIKQGDRVGVIGRNGAGKSTLLKVLSKITEPTTGQIRIKGRVASLLEVGTGFHPELTGRENIYLNGAILGMSRAEIKRKFDEIVDFAEVEKFLDTPVKRYSSGMYVRLAFAVAAHLEPEILVVDEVLAVGDAQFQKKCLGKMEDVSKEGRTIIFVSHNMTTVTTLCQKAIWLINGTINSTGDVQKIISQYLNHNAKKHSGEILLTKQYQNNQFSFKKISLIDVKGNISSVFDVREEIKIRIEYQLFESIKGLEVGFKLFNSSGIPVFSVERSWSINSELSVGIHLAEIEIPSLFLAPGLYYINLASHIPNIEIICLYESIMNFSVEETGSSHSKYRDGQTGVVIVHFPWREIILGH